MKVKVTLPSTLSEIKLSQYQKFIRTTKDSEDEDFIARQMVAIFCNLPDKTVKQIHAKDFNEIVKHLSQLIQQQGEFKPIVTHNGKEYGFIPNLDEITVGEKADLDNYLGNWEKMDKAMAICYRPIKSKGLFTQKDKYTIEDYTGEENPLDLTMDVVSGAMLFFYHLMSDLLNCTQRYIKDQVHQPKTLQILEQNGVGHKTFMHSLNALFSDMKEMLQKSSYTQHYSGSVLKPTKTN